MTAASATYPLDLVRTRLTAQVNRWSLLVVVLSGYAFLLCLIETCVISNIKFRTLIRIERRPSASLGF